MRRDPFSKPRQGNNSRRSRRPRKGERETSENSGSRSNRREQTRNSGATSRRRRKQKVSPVLIYGGVGGGALLLVGFMALMSSAAGSGTKAKIGHVTVAPAPAAAGDRGFSGARPYASVTEARNMLRRAHRLFASGEAKSQDARNRAYREARLICQRVLATPGVSADKRLEQDAGALCYAAYKCQSE